MAGTGKEGFESGAHGVAAENMLEIHTLGQFYVLKNGELLTAASGRLGKAWELFLYLVTHRQKLTPLEIIHENLWPGEESIDPKKNIKNLVHRLRKTLDQGGDSMIVYSQGCYRWNNNTDYWLDAEQFELFCQEARALSKSSPEEAADRYKEALKLYRGDYLPEFSQEDWVIHTRRYYHQLFLSSVLDLLNIYKLAGNYNEVIRICERTFLIEQFDEDLHLRYIEALLKEGKTTQARAHYQYITSLLYHEFGAKPSEAFQHMYGLIKSKENTLEFDIGEFRKVLGRYETTEGALLCEADTFALMCRVESRRAKREGSPACLTIITLTSPDYRLPPPKELQESMDKLNQVLTRNLRDGDFYSRWNESQFAVMLKGMDIETAENVVRRLKGKADKLIQAASVVVRTKVYPYLYEKE